MPKVSDAYRTERRQQILEAARRCIARHGLQGATMEAIIGESGLSTGAVYRYFASKDDIVLATMEDGLTAVGGAVAPLLQENPPQAPAALLGAITAAYVAVSPGDGYELIKLAPHGWSEAQRGGPIAASNRSVYLALRDRLSAIAQSWKEQGRLATDADPDDAAQVMVSLCLGFLAQEALTGSADPGAHERGLADLIAASLPSPATH